MEIVSNYVSRFIRDGIEFTKLVCTTRRKFLAVWETVMDRHSMKHLWRNLVTENEKVGGRGIDIQNKFRFEWPILNEATTVDVDVQRWIDRIDEQFDNLHELP